MRTNAEKGRELPAVEPQQTPVVEQQPQLADQQPTSTATYKGEYAVNKGAGYPSAMPVSGQGTVSTTQNSGQGEAGATNTTGQDQVVTTPQVEYKYDWGSGMTMADAYNQGKHSWADIYADRRAWGKANNSPVDNFEAVMLFPRNHDTEKSKIQNENDIKKVERKEKFDKIGNFLTHLGNFVGAAGFGGLDVKPEDPIKFTERQQRLKDKTEALRQSYNKEWFQNAAKQQAEERQLELARHKATYDNERLKQNQQMLDRQDADLYLRQRKQDWAEKYQQGKLDIDQERLRIQEDYNKGRLSQGAARIAIQELNAETNRIKATGTETVKTTDERGRTKTVEKSRGTYKEKKTQ